MVYYYESYPYNRVREPSIFDGFTLRPLPYPVLLILLVISVFLGIKLSSSYEEVAETTETQVNWLLLATPLLIIFAVKWLSSFQDPGYFVGCLPYDRRKWAYNSGPTQSGGASPWVVAALIALVIVLVQFKSVFVDS